jgi:hypothetical protein
LNAVSVQAAAQQPVIGPGAPILDQASEMEKREKRIENGFREI